MILEIDDKVSAVDFKKSLQLIRKNRVQRQHRNYSKFFGALPNIADGLEFQKAVRNEWN
ncbi:MAG: hypothetical protein FWC39_02670 [Bacteroidetes bacterium]|nr:hypothetical protein [Bacteroidota bacterium]